MVTSGAFCGNLCVQMQEKWACKLRMFYPISPFGLPKNCKISPLCVKPRMNKNFRPNCVKRDTEHHTIKCVHRVLPVINIKITVI
jgi:hypothetical protein